MSEPLVLSQLPAAWRDRAAQLERFAPAAAVAFREAAAELEAQLQSTTVDVVTLQEASLIGGYSVDHLQRMVGAGTITNVGRKGAPRIRRADVPTKPGHGVGSLPSPSAADQFSARRRIVADAQAHQR